MRLGRRGTIAIAAIAGVAMLQLCMVAVVVSGSRDHELTALRVQTMRAFYAADAAASLALRELALGQDADGDGVVGGIATRTLPGASSASASVLGPGTRIRAEGRSGVARRTIEVGVE
ncbi:hypothetical protein J4558_08065 [Leptolyngbya sp. 15MV]|nr:hypothetical protein J4558_08065 [Leptolyngbya sp. 15MV]